MKPNINGVSLEFHHLMSQVIITVENQSEDEIASVKVSETKNTVYVDRVNFSTSIYVTSSYINILARQTAADTFMAIIGPQQAALKITVRNTMNREISTTLNSITFESGMSYRVTVSINDDYEITDVDISSKGEIVDWVDGGKI